MSEIVDTKGTYIPGPNNGLEPLTTLELKKKAIQIRKALFSLIYEAKTGHTGGALSLTDIMTALYYNVMNIDPADPKNPDRDRFILSKGHSVEPLWCILADKGFFDPDLLKTFSRFGSKLIGHPNNKMPGVEMNTGSLGHGLSVASGMALAARMDGRNYRVFTIMGDGEQAEGSVWEGAMFAAHYKLDNLVAVVDRNTLQISGSTEDVMGLEPFKDKWEAFGWNVVDIDGNDMDEILEAFLRDKTVAGKPTMIIASTTKGKGVSFAENQAAWHHKVPTSDQYEQAMAELDAALAELEA